MADLSVIHEFDCDEATYWNKCFLDDEYNRRLYLERLHFPVWRITRQEATDEKVVRAVEVQPRIKDLPGPLLKIVGDKFGYVEEGTFDRREKRYRFRVIPSVMADRTKIEGEAYTEAAGPTKTRRIVKVRIEVKVFGLGGTIEQRSVADTKRSYDVSAEFTQAFLREKGLSAAG